MKGHKRTGNRIRGLGGGSNCIPEVCELGEVYEGRNHKGKFMKLSVIIPCFNAANTIATQLDALASQRWDGPWEIIVSNNGSTDDTLAILERYRERLPNFRIVDSSNRRGAAHARNVGALTATGDALAFIDADDVARNGWVAAMSEGLTRYDFVASRWDIEKLNSPRIQKSRFNPQQDGVNRYKYPPYLPHSGGSGIGIKRSIHEAVGGFDESMPRLQDTDYCWRVQLHGVKLHFLHDAVVHVRYPRELGTTFNQARLWGKYNVLIYKRYRQFGMPKLSIKTGVLAWRKLLRDFFAIKNPAKRGNWIFRFGWLLGRLQGSIRYRVLAL